jgi:hypothetical protein
MIKVTTILNRRSTMLTKKKIMIVMAIICTLIVSAAFSIHIYGSISCTAKSDCGECSVEDCESGGCVESSGAHACTCDGVNEIVICEAEV